MTNVWDKSTQQFHAGQDWNFEGFIVDYGGKFCSHLSHASNHLSFQNGDVCMISKPNQQREEKTSSHPLGAESHIFNCLSVHTDDRQAQSTTTTVLSIFKSTPKRHNSSSPRSPTRPELPVPFIPISTSRKPLDLEKHPTVRFCLFDGHVAFASFMLYCFFKCKAAEGGVEVRWGTEGGEFEFA